MLADMLQTLIGHAEFLVKDIPQWVHILLRSQALDIHRRMQTAPMSQRNLKALKIQSPFPDS